MADGQLTINERRGELTGLDLLRKPFPPNQISKLPKPTKKQTNDLQAAMDKKDFSLGIRCTICGGWHHKDVIHLDYVGHAALTDRLLDCDLNWNWEPYEHPALPTAPGGMWIRLTVCGVSRLGYGSADGKSGGDAIKEIIGDALRNAAMRFGAALDLWHKGDLHADEEADEDEPETLSVEQMKTLDALLTRTESDRAKFFSYAKAEGMASIQSKDFGRLKAILESKLMEPAQ